MIENLSTLGETNAKEVSHDIVNQFRILAPNRARFLYNGLLGNIERRLDKAKLKSYQNGIFYFQSSGQRLNSIKVGSDFIEWVWVHGGGKELTDTRRTVLFKVNDNKTDLQLLRESIIDKDSIVEEDIRVDWEGNAKLISSIGQEEDISLEEVFQLFPTPKK